MTEKLYDFNAYDKEFKATVTSCERVTEGFLITLDKTLFFPEEGGQSCDRGVINKEQVKHVSIKRDEIYHLLDRAFNVGEAVIGIIDFEHRFLNMQMHSGEHIFSGLVYKKYGFKNVGFHLSDNSATFDYDGKFSFEAALTLEKEVNEAIIKNIPVKTYFPSEDELEKLDYRSKACIKGKVRIVEIKGYDLCACCAPHVKSTGEIGFFKITGFENYKAGVRINYLCGFRALKDYNLKINSLNKISQILSCKSGIEEAAVSALDETVKKLKFKIVELNKRLVKESVERSLNDKENGIVFLLPEYTENIKYAMEILKKHYKGISIVCAGDDKSGYKFLIESDIIDLSDINNRLKDELNAKGGGRRDSIQGNVIATKEDIIKLLNL